MKLLWKIYELCLNVHITKSLSSFYERVFTSFIPENAEKKLLSRYLYITDNFQSPSDLAFT